MCSRVLTLFVFLQQRQEYMQSLVSLVAQHKLHTLALKMFAPFSFQSAAKQPAAEEKSYEGDLSSSYSYRSIVAQTGAMHACWLTLMVAYGEHLLKADQHSRAGVGECTSPHTPARLC